MVVISEIQKQDIELLNSTVVVEDYSSIGKDFECAYTMKAFYWTDDVNDTDKNDFTAPLYTLNNSQINASLYLEKRSECCEWVEMSQLNDNTYGYAYGSSHDPNQQFNTNTSWIGYHIDWWKVYNQHGEGYYRTRLEYDNLPSAETQIRYSYTYQLLEYSDDRADHTTRFNYKIKGGKVGDEKSDEIVINYNTTIWERQFRVRGIFGYSDSMNYEAEYTRYRSGAKVYTDNNGVEFYQCQLKGIPYSLHREFKKTMVFADEIIISDYNIDNIYQWKNKRVIRSGDYEINYDRFVSYYPATIEFSQYFENLRRKRC